MDALTLLAHRSSTSRLSEPGPDNSALTQMISCALRAPDHAYLRPWRFLIIDGDSRRRLGDLFASALIQRKPTAGADEIEKSRNAPLRAPVLIAVIGHIHAHAKVPAIEQTLSAGCGAFALVLAAQALGFGAVWRTGDNAYDERIKQGLGLAANESVIGYIYIGTPTGPAKLLPKLNPTDFMQRW